MARSFAKLLPIIKASELDQISAKSVTAAAAEVMTFSAGDSALEAQAESIGKRSATLLSACKKRDPGAAAIAAIKLADDLADIAYSWGSTERPLASIQSGTPPSARDN